MLRSSELDQDDSEIDTEDEELTETLCSEKLTKHAIRDAKETMELGDTERAEEIYRRMKGRYERSGVTVMVTDHRWIGTWNSIADCYLRRREFGRNILVIVS